MRLNSLTTISQTLRASSSRLIPTLLPKFAPVRSLPAHRQPLQVTPSRASHAVLEHLAPAPNSRPKKQRVGRGVGSKRGGHTSGRGHKGAKARGTGNPYLGFEGGQTPLYKKIPKRGFVNPSRKSYFPLPIPKIQSWIAKGRIDPTTPLTIYHAVRSNLMHGIGKYDGITLTGEPVSSLPFPPLEIRFSRFTPRAAEAVVKAGGKPVAVYHNPLSLRAEVHPEKFEGARAIIPAMPTKRRDILYYTDASKYGYLAGQKQKMFRERGWEPSSAKRAIKVAAELAEKERLIEVNGTV